MAETTDRRDILIAAARHAIEHGMAVFPIEFNSKNKFFGAKWQDVSTQDISVVETYFDKHGPNINLGIIPRRGFVIDWDNSDFGLLITEIAKHCTPDAAAEISTAIYSTYRVKTPRGGYHVYFCMPEGPGSEVYPKQYTHNHPDLKDLDTRVDTRGYVVAAGSQINKAEYSRIAGLSKILPAPTVLLDFLKREGKSKSRGRPRTNTRQSHGPSNDYPTPAHTVDSSGGILSAPREIKYVPLDQAVFSTRVKELKNSKPGARNATLFQVACKLFDRRYHRDDVYDPLVKAAREHGLTQREAQITVNSAWAKVTRKLKEFPPNTIMGDLKSNALYAFEELLEFIHLDFRFNVRSQVIEFIRTDEKQSKWDAWDDELAQYYISQIAQICVRRVYVKETEEEQFIPVEVSAFRFSAWIMAFSRQQEVDPFLVYIKTCHSEQSNKGAKITEDWIHACFQHDHTPLDKWIAQAIVCAAVQRAIQPGFKFDTMPVLYGKGGAGKSSMLKYIFPEEYRHEWSTDTIDFSMSNKDLVGIMMPTVFAEAQELKGLSQADRRHEKQVLSTHVDRVRLPYARRAGLYPRRSIIIGTTDDVDSLPRDSNMRRYAASSKMTGKKSLREILDYFNKYRDQIWASAYELVSTGQWLGVMPEELYQEQGERNTYMQVSEDAIESRLSKVPASVNRGVKFTVLKLYANMDKGDRELYSDHRLREYLKVAKWVKKRVRPVKDQENTMVTWYFPPDNNSNPEPCDIHWECCLGKGHTGNCQDDAEFSQSISIDF